MIQLNSSDVIITHRPEGGEPKSWIIYKGNRYLLKSRKQGWTNVESEHLASKLLNIIGINAHKTELVIIDNIEIQFNKLYNGLGVLCTDFTIKEGELSSYKEGTESIETDRDNYQYFFDDIVHILSKYHKVEFPEIAEDFFTMYCADLLLGNFDRHSGNWGICKKDGKRKFSPIYDNGACLLPRAKFEVIYTESDILGNELEWWKRRVYEFPTSKIMFKRVENPIFKERSNYYDVWNSDIIPEKIKNKFKNIDIIDACIKLFKDEDLEYFNKNKIKFVIKFILLRYYCIILNKSFNTTYLSIDKIIENIIDEIFKNYVIHNFSWED